MRTDSSKHVTRVDLWYYDQIEKKPASHYLLLEPAIDTYTYSIHIPQQARVNVCRCGYRRWRGLAVDCMTNTWDKWPSDFGTIFEKFLRLHGYNQQDDTAQAASALFTYCYHILNDEQDPGVTPGKTITDFLPPKNKLYIYSENVQRTLNDKLGRRPFKSKLFQHNRIALLVVNGKAYWVSLFNTWRLPCSGLGLWGFLRALFGAETPNAAEQTLFGDEAPLYRLLREDRVNHAERD